MRLASGIALALALPTFAAACKKPTDAGADASTTAAAVSASASARRIAKPAAPLTYPIEASPLAAGVNTFASKLWLTIEKKDNLAMSPASIALALSMMLPGAKGETDTEMRHVLHLDGVDPAGWKQPIADMTAASRKAKITIANRIYGEKSITFDSGYLDATKNVFGAAPEMLDFKTQADASRVAINAWVTDTTNKKIVDLMPPNAVKDSTRLVLVNAMTFLGQWTEPFPKGVTKPMPFEVDATTKKDVPTMSTTGSFLLGVTATERVVELPYAGDAAMYIVLPAAKDGLERVEKNFTPEHLHAWQVGLTSGTLKVTLPRFEVKPADAMTLAKPLTKLGMPLPFDAAKADFTGIANPSDAKDRIHVDEVFHKAYVKVDENGTEATAATAVAAAAGGPPHTGGLEVKIDHPFLFYILDKKTNLILFIGRVTDPTL